MQKAFLIVVVLVAIATPTLPQTADKTRTDRDVVIEQTVVKLTHEWIAADERGDSAALNRIIAEDFMGTGPVGTIVFKEDVIPMEGSRRGGLSITAQEVKARVFGDSAVVTGRGVRKSREQGDLRFTLVFANRQDRWQIVAGHLSTVDSRQ
ncbi:MAG: nuclear transport factor 2 family protein [Pyrinomonadaceae bacterium]